MAHSCCLRTWFSRLSLSQAFSGCSHGTSGRHDTSGSSSGRPYLDLPDSGEGEDETSADGDGVNHVDDDEKVPETTSVVRRQERVEEDALQNAKTRRFHVMTVWDESSSYHISIPLTI